MKKEIVIVTCDCCGKELNISNWKETINSLTVKLSQSSCNPLNKYDSRNHQNCEVELQDICSSCIRKLSNGITNILGDITKEIDWHDRHNKNPSGHA